MNKEEVKKELTRLGWSESKNPSNYGVPSHIVHYDFKDGDSRDAPRDIGWDELINLCAYFSNLNQNVSSSISFPELAESLRKLWPTGEKDGKYPWRDSVTNLTKRLEFIWENSKLEDKYTMDDCLQAARRYLAQFEDNTKYMQTLKYFIFKQNKIVGKDGKITYTYKSNLVDMLEGNMSADMQEDWSSMFDSNDTFDQGELI